VAQGTCLAHAGRPLLAAAAVVTAGAVAEQECLWVLQGGGRLSAAG
jgi:hypothetical protein